MLFIEKLFLFSYLKMEVFYGFMLVAPNIACITQVFVGCRKQGFSIEFMNLVTYELRCRLFEHLVNPPAGCCNVTQQECQIDSDEIQFFNESQVWQVTLKCE